MRSLVTLGAIVVSCTWARWRPAERFVYREVGADEFRVVTWNVGYFSPAKDKNARDVDIARIAEVLEDISPDVAVLQEVGSVEQADEVARTLGSDWRTHAVATGHGSQVIAVLTNLPGSLVETEEAGGRELMGVSLRDDRQRRFFVVAVHSPHPARGMSDTVASIRGAVTLIAGRDEPVRIMAGDMNYNFDPDGDGFGGQVFYDEITETVADSTAAIGETYYGHTRIDHVFHFPKELGVASEASGMVDLSARFATVPGFRDHRPIVITYDLADVF